MSLRLTLKTLFMLTIYVASWTSAATVTAHGKAREAGFVRGSTSDGTEIGIWYPASGTAAYSRLGMAAQNVIPGAVPPVGRHPLIVISHGTGGDFAGHVDTAIALARAGFIVAALTHPGDNWRDQSRATRIEDRPPALSKLITYMTSAWAGRASIDANRIGAFGFSAGGFTVLAAAGGRPDLARLAAHCTAHPAFFDCALVASLPRRSIVAWPGDRDPRIKAIVAAAPALGFTFDRAGLAPVSIPVQLWRADDDQVLPAPYYADAVRVALPRKPKFHHVPNAGHFDFLTPCVNVSNMPLICRSVPNFDRRAFHVRFNAKIVRFFRTALRRE